MFSSTCYAITFTVLVSARILVSIISARQSDAGSRCGLVLHMVWRGLFIGHGREPCKNWQIEMPVERGQIRVNAGKGCTLAPPGEYDGSCFASAVWAVATTVNPSIAVSLVLSRFLVKTAASPGLSSWLLITALPGQLSLQCFDTVGWAAGRASGL